MRGKRTWNGGQGQRLRAGGHGGHGTAGELSGASLPCLVTGGGLGSDRLPVINHLWLSGALASGRSGPGTAARLSPIKPSSLHLVQAAATFAPATSVILLPVKPSSRVALGPSEPGTADRLPATSHLHLDLVHISPEQQVGLPVCWTRYRLGRSRLASHTWQRCPQRPVHGVGPTSGPSLQPSIMRSSSTSSLSDFPRLAPSTRSTPSATNAISQSWDKQGYGRAETHLASAATWFPDWTVCVPTPGCHHRGP